MKLIILSLVGLMTLASGEKVFVPKPGGAVTAFNEEDGFKLSEKAQSKLGVTYSAIKGSGPWKIEKSALVRIKYSTGVYRKWDGWNTLVFVEIVSQTKEHYVVKSVDLEEGDQIAKTGVSFLRMTEADLNSDTVDACAH